MGRLGSVQMFVVVLLLCRQHVLVSDSGEWTALLLARTQLCVELMNI